MWLGEVVYVIVDCMQVDRRRSSSNAKIAVSAPPIPPPDEGKCIISKVSFFGNGQVIFIENVFSKEFLMKI